MQASVDSDLLAVQVT